VNIDELRAEIRKHDRLYYIDDAPEISDLEYDKLYKQLVDWEDAHPELITADSPTQCIGGLPSSGCLVDRWDIV
jgi:DNA ligase (NAD+)